MPLFDTQKPANSPEPELAMSDAIAAEAMAELAKELADELGVSRDEKSVDAIVSKLRWYPRGNPPAIVIVRRGANRKVLATISPKSGKWAHLYPTWERVLTELAKEKAARGVSRLSHEGMEAGEIPLAKDD